MYYPIVRSFPQFLRYKFFFAAVLVLSLRVFKNLNEFDFLPCIRGSGWMHLGLESRNQTVGLLYERLHTLKIQFK